MVVLERPKGQWPDGRRAVSGGRSSYPACPDLAGRKTGPRQDHTARHAAAAAGAYTLGLTRESWE